LQIDLRRFGRNRVKNGLWLDSGVQRGPQNNFVVIVRFSQLRQIEIVRSV